MDTANTGPDAQLGPDARLLARSQNGDLSIYMRDTPEMLALIYQKGADVPVTVFESERVLKPRAASRSAHE